MSEELETAVAKGIQARIGQDFDVLQLIADLDGGRFLEKLKTALFGATANALTHEKPANVDIKFTVKKAGRMNANLSHSIVTKVPTEEGELSETNNTATPVYVSAEKGLTLFPEAQHGDLFPGRPKGQPTR